jgi:predicted ATPase
MKLRELTIKNFRGIENVSYDFTNLLGEPYDVILIVGPNGSGKTSILDAIWFGLRDELGGVYPPQLREGFRPEAEFVVRDGKRYTQVDYHIEISEDEQQQIIQWKEMLVNEGVIGDWNWRNNNLTGEISWTYPAQTHKGYEEKPASTYGGYHYENGFDWQLMRGWEYYNKLRRLSAHPVPGRKGATSLAFFEQERRLETEPVHHVKRDNDNPDENIRSLLVDFGIKQQLGRFDKEESWYAFVQKGFNFVCAPRRMGDVFVVGSDDDYRIEFFDGKGMAYTFDGLSSGERSVLNFLTQFVYRFMYNAIILIDELELHLHGTWQRRLLQYLQQQNNQDNRNNQLIITTHSPTLMQVVPAAQTIELGELMTST